MNLRGTNIVVFDCEIENVIDGTNVTWNDHDRMGLSVACLYDFKTDDYSVFFKEDIVELCERLNTADLVVAFNQKGFDNKLLNANGGHVDESNHYDMLEESRLATGWREGERYPTGLKLDNHLSKMFGTDNMKTADGAMAPIWWKEGKRAKVVSYCLADVKREKMLFEFIAENGFVITQTHGRRALSRSKIFDAYYKHVEAQADGI